MIYPNRRSKTLAKWLGVMVGLIFGMACFVSGMQTFFIGGAKSWMELVAFLVAVLALLAQLPFAVLAISAPRPAAYGIMVSGLAYTGIMLCANLTTPIFSYSDFALFLLGFLVVPFVAAGLLFYASSSRALTAPLPGEKAQPLVSVPLRREGIPPYFGERGILWLADCAMRMGRREQARWAAVVVGLIAGVRLAPWGIFSMGRAIHAGYWMAGIGAGAVAVTLFPLGIVAIFKPRLAAYGALASLMVALLYPLIVLHPLEFGASGALGGILMYSLLDIPLASLTALLLYATTGRSRR